MNIIQDFFKKKRLSIFFLNKHLLLSIPDKNYLQMSKMNNIRNQCISFLNIRRLNNTIQEN